MPTSGMIHALNEDPRERAVAFDDAQQLLAPPATEPPHEPETKRRMRVAFITEWFPPEPAAAPLWIAQALRDNGAQVAVVTGAPHYPSGNVGEGFRAWRRVREVRDGFPVIRVPEYPSHDTSAARRMATFGSFALSSSALAGRAVGGADVALVYSSPATAALPALIAKLRYSTPYVLLVQDLWPDSVFASGMLSEGAATRIGRAGLGSFVSQSYRHASHIAVISPGMRTRLIQRGVPPEKISVIYNWVDESVLRPLAPNGLLRSRLGLSATDVLVVHAGNQGEAQSLGPWIEAIGRLADLRHVHLVLLGTGTQHGLLRRLTRELALEDRVHFLPPVPLAAVAELTADADALVVSLRNDPLFAITLPSKTQAALAQGKPVLVSAPGDAAQLITAAGAGWVALPDDPDSMGGALRSLESASPPERRRRGIAAFEYYRVHMSASAGGSRITEILRRAASR